jgi:uncharacterized protein (TIGR03083 family)
MATVDSAQWDATNHASRDNLLRVVNNEAESVFELAGSNWGAATKSGHWEVRDIIGHLVDVTEGYLNRFSTTRQGGVAEAIAPLTDMAKFADERALEYRSVSQQELIGRLKGGYEEVIKVFMDLSPEDWTGFTVTHGYMGPLPAFIYPVFQLMDYGVHGWDIREGLGMAHSMSPDVADFLHPFMFILWQATCDASRLADEPLEVGFKVSGRNGAEWKVHVDGEGYKYEQGSTEGMNSVFEFDPASLVLTAFGRVSAGTAYGDQAAATRYRQLFFAI